MEFRVQKFTMQVQEFRVWNLGFEVQDPGYVVQGLVSKAQVRESRVCSLGLKGV